MIAEIELFLGIESADEDEDEDDEVGTLIMYTTRPFCWFVADSRVR